MKNNPLLQIAKIIGGLYGSYKFLTAMFAAKNEYSAFLWLICFIISAAIAYHGWAKFRGEEY